MGIRKPNLRKVVDMEERRAIVRASLRKRRKMLAASGRCVDCGLEKSYEDLGSLCALCKSHRRERGEKLRNKKKGSVNDT